MSGKAAEPAWMVETKARVLNVCRQVQAIPGIIEKVAVMVNDPCFVWEVQVAQVAAKQRHLSEGAFTMLLVEAQVLSKMDDLPAPVAYATLVALAKTHADKAAADATAVVEQDPNYVTPSDLGPAAE